jgi:hypothetical protein
LQNEHFRKSEGEGWLGLTNDKGHHHARPGMTPAYIDANCGTAKSHAMASSQGSGHALTRRACFLAQFFLERLEQCMLFLGAEFFALLGEVEDVDGLLAFCVNQGDFDVAPQAGQR